MDLNKAYAEELKKEFEHKKIHHIKVAITDINGILRSKYLSTAKFLSALSKGFGFCDVILGSDIDDQLIDGLQQTGWQSGYPDGTVSIDLQTGRDIPYEPHCKLYLSHYTDAYLCPRALLKRLNEQAIAMGYHAKVGMEFEFTLFDETPQGIEERNFQNLNPLTPGNHGYSFIRTSVLSEFHQELLDVCEKMAINVEGLHTEIGPGVMEAAIGKSSLLEAADKAILFKHVVKTLAQKRGLMASFMAKWSNEHQGQSGHIHMSLCNAEGDNLFFDEQKQENMSDVMQHFIAGQALLMPEFLVLAAPFVNSFNRLTPGFWAPTQATWGIDNRTCALRVINNAPAATRIEYRIPGADCNPYLAMSAALASGLWGIKEQQKPAPKIQGNAYEQTTSAEYKLPSSLENAASRFKHSEIACHYFGEKFVKDYAISRQWEAEQAHRAITDWQLKRYFELA